MGNSYTTQDLVKRTLQYAGETTDGSSPYHDLALVYLNKVYFGVLSGESEFAPDIGEPWVWARNEAPINLVLQPAYTTGSVSIQQNATTGSFVSSSAPTISYQNSYLHVTPNPSYYLITAHNANQSTFTIEMPFIETTATSASFQVLPLIYDLAALTPKSILKLVEPFRVYDIETPNSWNGDVEQQGKIFGLDLNRLRRDYPIATLSYGTPERFATYRQSDTEWKVIFERCPGINPIKVDIDYISVVDDLTDNQSSIPLLPKTSRPLLADGAAYYLLTDKNDDKAQAFFNRCKLGIETMKRAQDRQIWKFAKERGRILPRGENRRMRWPFYW